MNPAGHIAGARERRRAAAPARMEIDRMIDRLGARYIADLRLLSEELSWRPSPGVRARRDNLRGTHPSASATAPAALEYPRRLPEVEPVGPVQDMAYADQQWLICYAGAHYIQATTWVYHILRHADGETSVEEIARRVAAETDSDLGADQVRWLVAHRLLPSGLLAAPAAAGCADGMADRPAGESARQGRVTAPPDQLLGIRYRIPLLPYAVTAPVASALQCLFWPPVMIAVTLLAVAGGIWLLLSADVYRSLQGLLFSPEQALLLFAIELACVLFHELGHAAALRRAGARYGTIGAALYIIWPIFYTDVTHMYRLNRAQKLRVDLGGIYFQLVATVLLWGLYLATGWALLLLAMGFTLVTILDQFTPFLRFDGYFTIADIVGVHEPLALIGPFIHDHLPWNRRALRRFPPVRRFARIAFAVYLMIVGFFLAYPFYIWAFYGRRILTLVPQSGRAIGEQFIGAWRDGAVALVVLTGLQLLFWVLAPLGIALFFYTTLRRLLRGARVLGRLLRRLRGRTLDGAATRVSVAALCALIVAGTAFGVALHAQRASAIADAPRPVATVEPVTAVLPVAPRVAAGAATLPPPPDAAALTRREIAAESTVSAGEFAVTVTYPNGTYSRQEVRFDFRDAATPRLQLTATFEGANTTETVERIVIGDRAWQRDSSAPWRAITVPADKRDLIANLLPHLERVADAGVAFDGANALLRWQDSDGDALLRVDPVTGAPQELTRTTPASGMSLAARYVRWGSAAPITPPEDPTDV
jgi:hypothetical protein